jgi:predicted phosphodiesterase
VILPTLELRPTSGELWGILTDSHHPIQDQAVIDLALEIMEAAGVDRAAHLGDFMDYHVVSTHKKDPERMLKDGTLEEQAETAKVLLTYLREHRGILIEGNHDARPRLLVTDKWPHLVSAMSLPALLPLDGIALVGQGGRIRVGSYVFAHGDYFFKKTIPANPVAKVLKEHPDQTTTFGHVHRRLRILETRPNKHGLPRTRGAYSIGHSSIEEKHADYMGASTGWQQSMQLVRWHYPEGETKSPQAEITEIEFWRDRRNRPYAMWNGSVWR